MIITSGQGLGNRVAALANAISRGGEVTFKWAVNEHCPVGHEVVFPSGIEGVEFQTVKWKGINFTTRADGKPLNEWANTSDRVAANTAYATIMAAMAGSTMESPPKVAIRGRFWRTPTASPQALADAAAVVAQARGEDRVFVFCDLHRAVIEARLAEHQLVAVAATSKELTDSDLDRPSTDMQAYLDDWKTLLASEDIVACDGPTSTLHPARAAGIRIVYAGGD